MNKLAVTMAMVMALAAGAAGADDSIFKADTSMAVASGSRENPGQRLVVGTVTLSSKGEIKVLWDGVSLNPGDYAIGEAGGRTFVSANLPAAYLDLQKIFGANWMEAIRLTLASGSYLSDPITGKSDLTLGQISINLTQTLASRQSFKWTITEGVGTAGYFRRQLNRVDQPFEAVPVSFSLDTKVVANLSSDAVVAISLGAFANICNGINHNADFRAVVAGGYVAPSVSFGKHWETGARAQALELVQVAGGGSRAVALNVSGFVKYAFTADQGKVRQAIELTVGALEDGTVIDRSGNPTRANIAGLRYSVAF